MKIQIKAIFTDSILFEGEFESTRHAVEKAVSTSADLYGADLYGADLYGADDKPVDKIISVSQMFGIDGSGRQIMIYFCEKDTWVSVGCFFGTVKEFCTRAKSENKMIYVKVVGDFCKLKRKQLTKGGDNAG